MIVKLHHDFFEAWRQDTLDMCRLQRDRVMSEGPGEEAQLDQSTREWMISVNSSKPEAGATRMEQPAEKSCIPRFYNTESSPGERIYGTGGNWSGILEPHTYPLTMQFFEDLQYWMQPDKVFERTYQGQEKLMKQSHGAKPSPKGISIPERLDLDAPGIKVKDASKEVAKMVGELQRIPREAKRPQAVSLASNTLSVAVVQRSENAKARRAAVKDVVSHAESMASLAEGQREATDAHIKEVNLWRGHREACSQESRGSWKNEAQERNFANAYRRAEHWYKRREAVHESEMEAEEKRYEATIKIAQRDVAVTMRVGRIRDLTRIKFARQWLERRIRWAKQETITSKKMRHGRLQRCKSKMMPRLGFTTTTCVGLSSSSSRRSFLLYGEPCAAWQQIESSSGNTSAARTLQRISLHLLRRQKRQRNPKPSPRWRHS